MILKLSSFYPRLDLIDPTIEINVIIKQTTIGMGSSISEIYALIIPARPENMLQIPSTFDIIDGENSYVV
jgi:hypothetical protein